MGIFFKGLSKHLRGFPSSFEQSCVILTIVGRVGYPRDHPVPKRPDLAVLAHCPFQRTQFRGLRLGGERKDLLSGWECPGQNGKARDEWVEGTGSRERAATHLKFKGTWCVQRRKKQSCQWTGALQTAYPLRLWAEEILYSRGMQMERTRSQLGPSDLGSLHWEALPSFWNKLVPATSVLCMQFHACARQHREPGVCEWSSPCLPHMAVHLQFPSLRVALSPVCWVG